MSRAEDVRIIKPDGSTTVTSAHDFRNRLPEDEDMTREPEGTDKSPFTMAELLAQVEEQTMRTLLKTMREGTDHRERTAAATAAVKYLAIKYRVGPEFGADLDE